MKQLRARIYDAHKDYNIRLDTGILNMKIRIYDENFDKTGTIFYEGSVGKFIKERIPSEALVELLTNLKHKDKLSYQLSGCQNFIEKIR